MRRIVACVAAAIAATAIAAPAQAQGSRDCYEDYQRDGRSVEVFCDDGGHGRFRATAHCHNGLGTWDAPGSIGFIGDHRHGSYAECNALLGPVWVDGYHVHWL